MSGSDEKNNESLPLGDLEQIDKVCSRFEDSWKARSPTRIEDLLQGFAGRVREKLLLELLLLEFEYRSQSGDDLPIPKYRQRFPDDLDIVEQALEQSSQDQTIVTPGQAVDAQLIPGRIRYLGDYEILEEIARGGMGIVFKARQTTLSRIVAIKMMLSGQLSSDEQIARFEREAKLAGRLQHPNIVAVHEVGRHEGMPYFSMDYVDGQSLGEMVRDNPLPPRDAARYMQVAAETVSSAHSEGILHRDIKPSNILIDQDNRVRITDFGLAKAMESGETLSLTDSVIGTPSYMPPEQAVGNQALIGVQSDVYSLGAALYELLTGRPPFAAATAIETMHQLKTKEPVSPRVLNPDVPKDLETICLKCLEKEPHKRYGTAQELANDLRRFGEDRPVLARPVSSMSKTWRWMKRNPLAASLLALVLFLATVGPTTAGWMYVLSSTLEDTINDKARLIGELDTALHNEQQATKNAQESAKESRRHYLLARSVVDEYLVQITDDPQLRSHGLERLRRKLLLTARDFYDRFTGPESDDPELDAERADASMKLGNITREIGSIEESLRHYRHALRLLNAISQQALKDANHEEKVADCLRMIGILNEESGEFVAAQECFENATEIFQRRYEQESESLERATDYANGLHSLGMVHWKSGDSKQARKFYEKAINVRRCVLERDPDHAGLLRSQAVSFNSLGALYYSNNKFREAEALFRQAIRTQEQLVQRLPDNYTLEAELADGILNLASVFVDGGKPDKAEPHFKRALQLYASIGSQHPDVPLYQFQFAKTIMNMGVMYSKLNRNEEAKDAFLEALRHAEALMKKDAKAIQYETFAASCHLQLGGLFHEARDYESAVRHRTAVVEQMERVVNRVEMPDEEPSLTEAERLSRNGNLDTLRGELSDSLHKLALHYYRRGGYDRAQATADRSVGIRQDLYEKYPENRRVLTRTVESRLILAVSLARLQKYERAASQIDIALDSRICNADIIYNAACGLALVSAGVADNTELSETYAKRAVSLLATGVEEGTLSAESDLKQAARDSDLASIRRREDFRQLLEKYNINHVPEK